MTREYTLMEKFQNWLHYHIWYLVAAGFLLAVGGSRIVNKMNQAKQASDYCVAYIGTYELPDDCVTALKGEIAALGADADGDGKVTVKINQYIVGDTDGQDGDASYGRVAEVALLTDITKGESYFFLVEYPEDFQLDFQLMAHLDGSPSDDADFGVWDKVYRWGDCPALAGLELETDHQKLLEDLYLGRRCFVQPGMKIDSRANRELWAALTEGATLPTKE